MVKSRKNYDTIGVRAARSVLLELVRLLGEYRNDIAVVGGWVPSLLFENAVEKHIGSTDVDIALNHRTIDDGVYKTIHALLINRGYTEGKQPYIFFRTVTIEGTPVEVEVDFLAGEYQGTGKSHRTQRIQDLNVRKTRGCELAFELQDERVVVGELPGGGRDSASVKVAAIVPFIIMKGMALHDRIKEKDAWDIYYCVRQYPGGNEKLAEVFQRHLGNKLVVEGLNKIAAKFESLAHYGPTAVADFDEVTDPEERDFRRRDAFERIHDLLSRLGAV